MGVCNSSPYEFFYPISSPQTEALDSHYCSDLINSIEKLLSNKNETVKEGAPVVHMSTLAMFNIRRCIKASVDRSSFQAASKQIVEGVDFLVSNLERISAQFKYAVCYSCLRLIALKITVLHDSEYPVGDVEAEKFKSTLLDWLPKIRRLEEALRRRTDSMIEQGDRVPTPGSLNALTLEVKKLNLLVVSFPNPKEGSNNLWAGVQVLGGLVDIALVRSSGIKEVIEGLGTLTSSAISTFRRSNAEVEIKFFMRLESIVENAYMKMHDLLEVVDTNYESVFISRIEENISRVQGDIFGLGDNIDIKNYRWEKYGAYCVMLAELILCLSPVTYLRNKVFNEVLLNAVSVRISRIAPKCFNFTTVDVNLHIYNSNSYLSPYPSLVEGSNKARLERGRGENRFRDVCAGSRLRDGI